LKRKTRKTDKTLNITADRAAHVLHILIAEGKLTGKNVSDALKRRERLIRELRQRLDALERGAVSAVERTPKRRMTATRREGVRPKFQSPQQRKLTRYQERERPKPDRHGGSGSGRQQGGSGAGREHG
jgi:hypothetical protein